MPFFKMVLAKLVAYGHRLVPISPLYTLLLIVVAFYQGLGSVVWLL